MTSYQNNSNEQRQIVLDTETTGMNKDGANHFEGHKIIEIGAVELINRKLTGNHFHVYINPMRKIDEEAFHVHGISNQFLDDKPTFADISTSFIEFIDNAELIIHNAPFDVGFIDYEFRLANIDFNTQKRCKVTDTLTMAKRMFPGKRNNLDALCDRFHIDNSKRTLHGALLDAEILAEVYLAMTGGQSDLSFSTEQEKQDRKLNINQEITQLASLDKKLKVLLANEQELTAHHQYLDLLDKKSGGALWRK